jgi:hypothetical protein
MTGFFRGRDGFFEPLADPLCGDAEKWFVLNSVGLLKGVHSPKKSGLRFFLGQYLSFQGGDF